MRLGVLPMLVVVSMLVVGCTDDDKSDPNPIFPGGADGDNRVTVLDEEQLEGQDGIKAVLVNDYKLADIESVDCPADQEVRKGNTFDCAVMAGGKDLTVEITITSDDGVYQVGLPE
jgi:Domain of unknown function (DUF4333)